MRPLGRWVVGAVVALGPAGALSAVAPVAAETGAAGVVSAVAAARSGHHIDNGDKDEVRTAYESRFADNVDTPSGWIGSVDLCLAGTVSDAAVSAVLESVNFVRAMAGLDRVGFGDGLSAKAQQAALLMDANNSLSHDPPQSWNCWTEEAADAAGHSNLTITTGTMDAGEAVELYMDDPGASNKVAGHRRWILRPEAKTFGTGMTDTANALWVIGPTSYKKADPRWVSWPSAGWFPSGLEPQGRWSLSTRSTRTDFRRATVTVREKGGSRLEVQKYKPVLGYARPTLVFRVAGLKDTGTYVATVSGVRGAAKSRHTWTVKLFE